MKKVICALTFALILSSCGINLNTPKEMGLKVDLDAKGIAKQLRQGASRKVPAQYQKFLKAKELLAYLRLQAHYIQGECLTPTRGMAEGEEQGDRYVFIIHMKCFVHQADRNRTLAVEFDIGGFINVGDLKHEFVFEPKPEMDVTTADAGEYKYLRSQGRFLPVE